MHFHLIEWILALSILLVELPQLSQLNISKRATRLFSGNPPEALQFENRQYCAILSEDAPIASSVVNVKAWHQDGLELRYSITGGNRDGLFTIDQFSGAISVAAPLDRETQTEYAQMFHEHELVVAVESRGEVANTLVRVAVADVNDNPPKFLDQEPVITVIEEDDRDLPKILLKAKATDEDWIDKQGLLYTAAGEGIDGYSPRDAFFSIDPKTGDLLQLRPLDRDPPHGKSIWKIKIKVYDGQTDWSFLGDYFQNHPHPFRHEATTQGIGKKRKPSKDPDHYYKFDENLRFQVSPDPKSSSHIIIPSYLFRDSPDQVTITRQSRKTKGHKKENTLDEAEIENMDEITQLPKPLNLVPSSSLEGGSKIIFQEPKLSDSLTVVDVSFLRGNIATRSKRSVKKVIIHNIKNNPKLLNLNVQNKYENKKKLRRYQFPKYVFCSDLYSLLCSGLKNINKIYDYEVIKECLDSYCIINNILTMPYYRINNRSNLFANEIDYGMINWVKNYRQNKKIKKRKTMHEAYFSDLSQNKINNNLCTCVSLNKIHLPLCNDTTQRNLIDRKLGSKNFLHKTSINSKSEGNFKSKSKKTFSQTIKMNKQKIFYKDFTPENFKTNIRAVRYNNLQKESFNKKTETEKNLVKFLKKRKWKFSTHDKSSDRPFSWRLQSDKSHFSILLPFQRIKVTRLFHVNENQLCLGTDTNNELFPRLKYFSNVTTKSSIFLQMQSQKANRGCTKKRFKENFIQNEPSKALKEKTANGASKYFHNKRLRKNRLDLEDVDMKGLLKILNFPQYSKKAARNIFLQKREGKANAFQYITKGISSNGLQYFKGRHFNVAHSPRGIVLPSTPRKAIIFDKESQNIAKVAFEKHTPYFLSPSLKSKVEEGAPKRLKRATKPQKAKRHESFSDYFVVDKGGCLQYNDWAGRKDDAESKININISPGPEMLTIREEQLRHVTSQVIRSRGHRTRGKVHVTETIATIVVKDINDNAPVFPNVTMYGEVQENGPIDLSVAMVKARDADDENAGTNARLTYSIEKNVIDERSGQSIFDVHPRTGKLKTAICCLDRETTPDYKIQVVASDGGGLKGTGTVVVRLADVNDNSPILPKREWRLTIDETPGTEPPTNSTLLEIFVIDPDISNYFFYKIVESSGWGWDLFGIRTVGSVGELFAKRPLDYENEGHRKGFRFLVSVTDKGRGAWDNPKHTDSAWVSIQLRGINDNHPIFDRKVFRVTVREDVFPGTILATLKASDPDMPEGIVDYHLLDAWSRFQVGLDGTVKVRLPLDREGPDGSSFAIKVMAVDRGSPPLSSTTTLSITLSDVNDCPPRLLPPVVLHIKENVPPKMIGTLFATDDDVWSLGHGPPFNISLGALNPDDVRRKVTLKYKKELDSGRGGAEVWTMVELDREQNRQLTVDITISDAANLIRTQPIVIIVDDVNDNMMRAGSKSVHLWKTDFSGSDVPLGRIYVEDPDDWDISDKIFSWVGPPHPFFSLNEKLGTIMASRQAREGRYELCFAVSDHAWRQKFVEANVSVTIRLLSPEALNHAIPLTLLSVSPVSLTKEWDPEKGGGQLGSLTKYIKDVLGDVASDVEVVSVYGSSLDSGSSPFYLDSYHRLGKDPQITRHFPLPSATVWISVQDSDMKYLNPVKLKGLVQMRLKKLVDSNRTSLVTPRLTSRAPCPSSETMSSPYPGDIDQCNKVSCLNGGRCIATERGKRCVCPGNTVGPECKILSRSFVRGSWAWISPLPNCHNLLEISMKFLTRNSNGVFLNSAPLTNPFPHTHLPRNGTPQPLDLSQYSYLALQLLDGRVVLIYEGGGEMKRIATNNNQTLADGKWHTINVLFTKKGVSLITDGLLSPETFISSPWSLLWKGAHWGTSSPIQIGGLANRAPHERGSKRNGIVSASLEGCISELRIAGELIDLGEVAFSKGSVGGCLHKNSCHHNCGIRGTCIHGDSTICSCAIGWTEPTCEMKTTPTTLRKDSFAKVALSFTPRALNTVIQLRFRTRKKNATLLTLIREKEEDAFSIYIKERHLCFALIRKNSVLGTDLDEISSSSQDKPRAIQRSPTSAPIQGPSRGGDERYTPAKSICIEREEVSNGEWHLAKGIRLGHTLYLELNEGDRWRKNSSFESVVESRGSRADAVDSWVEDAKGGTAAIIGKTFLDDILDDSEIEDAENLVCIDDVRVSGHPLPLPPAMNGSQWGQVTTMAALEVGCAAPDVCLGISCAPPFVCRDEWLKPSCGCPTNYQFTREGCRKLEQCLYDPCLNGGKCNQGLITGYTCSCPSGISGRNCEWSEIRENSHGLRSSFVLLGATLSFIFILLVLGFIVFRIYCHPMRKSKCDDDPQASNHSSPKNWKPAYLKKTNGKTNVDITPVMDSLFGRIQSKENKQSAKTQKNSQNLKKVKWKTLGSDIEISNIDPEGPEVCLPTFPLDDLRVYTYETEQISAGSLDSAISGAKCSSCAPPL